MFDNDNEQQVNECRGNAYLQQQNFNETIQSEVISILCRLFLSYVSTLLYNRHSKCSFNYEWYYYLLFFIYDVGLM